MSYLGKGKYEYSLYMVYMFQVCANVHKIS